MEAKDRKVKGSLLLDYVRMMHADKSKDWGKYLTKEELDLINGRILASVWYPADIYIKCGDAVFHELARGSLNVSRQFGKFNADTLFQGTYKGTLEAVLTKGGGVVKFLERYAAMTPNLLNFANISIKPISEKRAICAYKVELDFSEFPADGFLSQLAGTIEKLIELAGGKNVTVNFTIKKEPGTTYADYDATWG